MSRITLSNGQRIAMRLSTKPGIDIYHAVCAFFQIGRRYCDLGIFKSGHSNSVMDEQETNNEISEPVYDIHEEWVQNYIKQFDMEPTFF